jgi:hypothetical protein
MAGKKRFKYIHFLSLEAYDPPMAGKLHNFMTKI